MDSIFFFIRPVKTFRPPIEKKIVMLNDFPLITNISTLECSLKNTFVKKKNIYGNQK